ncbi:MAG: cysteine--tRNA ligase [Halieaceae bacterium]|jgi:cysteinyl-tRNA synthetase|nr:cysteine--tRNA ligase [Halieaceae bacterium]
MSLYLYNTMGGVKQLFEPLVPDRVTMYVCGPTVYNLAHIGNARPVVVFDTLFRLLQSQFSQVTYARNITDVEDKILEAAKASNRSISSITDEYTTKYREDMAQLNALQPTLEPQATHNIEPMIELTRSLIARGHAYESQGHVLFAVESMAEYGKLSGRSLDDMLAGARVKVADYKRHPGDFVLWKPAAEEEPGWDSPWGHGRPGWHLECSAMIREHLGETIDIHGGGRDLIFPHHENEIAQSCCSRDGDYVRYWMHNAYLDIDGEKMSKSLGNFRTVRELLKSYRGEVLRFALLSAHYRSPLNFSVELLDQAEATLSGLYNALREVEGVPPHSRVALADEPFYAAMNDDLNTPVAIAEIHALSKAMNKAAPEDKLGFKARILAAGELLGILHQDPRTWLQGAAGEKGVTAEQVEALIEERIAAKLARDYARADEIRQQLLEQGVILEDSREGTKWRRESTG